MNREQRRLKGKKGVSYTNRFHVVSEEHQPDFSGVPLATICQSINLLIDEIRGRGIKICDYDDKERSVMGVQIIRGNVYFLAAKEEAEHEEVRR